MGSTYFENLLLELKTLALLCLKYDLQDEYLEVKILEREIQTLIGKAA